MKSCSPILAIVALFLTLQATALADLTVHCQSNAGGQQMDMTLKYSAGKIRADTKMGSSIILPEEKKVIILMPQVQRYMIMPQPEPVATGEESSEMPQLTRTGKKETINGFECEQVIVKPARGYISELWISKKGPSILDFATSMNKLNSGQMDKAGFSWFRFLGQNSDMATFPIRVITFDNNAQEVSRMTVTSFDHKTVSPTEFSPPPNYTEQQMPAMPASTGNGIDMEQLKKMKEQMMKGGRPSPEQIEQMKKMAEQMQGMQGGE